MKIIIQFTRIFHLLWKIQYTVIHRQTVSFYQNSSVWLDTQDARSRDRNPSNFTLDEVSDLSATKQTTLSKGILRYLFQQQQQQPLFTFFIPYRLPECSILTKSFTLRKQRPTIPSPEYSTPMGERIYCHPLTDCFVLSELFSVARHAGRSVGSIYRNSLFWFLNVFNTLLF